jgi:hypothetical protein
MTASIKIETTLDNELVIHAPTGAIAYRGKPDGYPVLSACATEDDHVLVLWEGWTKKYGSKDNLLLLDSEGRIIWRAQLPDPSSGDSYTEFKYLNGHLTAFSWSCHRVAIDMKTGNILQSEFTK